MALAKKEIVREYNVISWSVSQLNPDEKSEILLSVCVCVCCLLTLKKHLSLCCSADHQFRRWARWLNLHYWIHEARWAIAKYSNLNKYSENRAKR